MMIMIEIIVEVLCNLVSCGARPFKAQVHLHSGVGCWLVQVFFLVFVKSHSVRFYPMVWIDGQWCAQSVVVVFNALQFSRVLSSGEDGSGDCCRWQAGGREANVFVCLSYYLCYCVSGFVIVFLPSLCLFVFVCKEWIYAKGLSCGQCRLSSTRFMFPKFNNIWVNLIICRDFTFGLEVKAVLWDLVFSGVRFVSLV